MQKHFLSNTRTNNTQTTRRVSIFLVALFVWLWLLVCVFHLSAQSQSQNSFKLNFERIGREQGLSESVVTSILQDRRGFLWVGTANGLNRYDGYGFTVFRQNSMDTTSLANNSIKALYEDRSGALWVGTQNGLHRYDRFTGRFQRIQHNPESKNTLSNNDITAIAQDDTGSLWIGTKRGLNLYNPQTGVFKLYKVYKKKNYKRYSLSDNEISAVFIEPRATPRSAPTRAGQRIWIGTRTGGVNVLNTETGIVTVIRNDPENGNSLSDDAVSTISSSDAHTLWVGTRNGGVNIITLQQDTEPSAATVENESLSFDIRRAPDDLSDNVVRSMARASSKNGAMWVGTRNGLNLISANDQSRSTYRNIPNNSTTLSDNDVSAVFEDRMGNLWVGTNAGLNKFVPRTEVFNNLRFNASDGSRRDDNTLRMVALNGIAQHMADSSLWVATSEGAWNISSRWRGGDFLPRLMLSTENKLLSDDHATNILPDRLNSDIVWVATESGLNQYSLAKRTTQTFRHDANDPASLADDYVNCLYQDRSGVIWIGTSGGGLSSFDPQTQDFTTFRSDSWDSTSLADNFVFAILEDRSGRLWVGTSGGLSVKEPQAKTFHNYRHSDRNAASLSENSVLSLCEDRAGNLWVGTYGGGVERFRNGLFEHLREKDGLPSDVVYGIIEDARSRLWLSTGRGLVRLLMPSGGANGKPTLRVYDVTDGLLANEFRKGAYYRALDGTLYFGVGNGFTSFHPDSLRDNTTPPAVVITGFRKYNQLVELDSSITETKELVLEPSDNTFSFEFAALDFSNPSKNQYAYRLLNFDDRWIFLGNERMARYTNLDPGEYVFQVKAANSDGTWNEDGVSLRVIVRPPWWQTLWFRALSVMLIVGVVVGGYKWRVQSIQLRNKRLESLVTVRTEEIVEKNAELERLLEQAECSRRETQQAYNMLELEHARKSAELEEARVLQLSMLPTKTPSVEGLDVAFSMQTATEVGGDYYDYAISRDGVLTLAIGDATGHGVRAGMLVSIVKSNFHALAESADVATIAGHICRNIKRMNLQRMFMCLTLLRYRRVSHGGSNSDYQASVEFSGAGMPPTLIYRAATGTVEKVFLRGIVLGAVEQFEYPTNKLYLKRGDAVLMMSDGLVELFNHSREELGEERIISCFQSIGSLSAEGIIATMNRLATEWLGECAQHDDIALVALKQQ